MDLDELLYLFPVTARYRISDSSPKAMSLQNKWVVYPMENLALRLADWYK